MFLQTLWLLLVLMHQTNIKQTRKDMKFTLVNEFPISCKFFMKWSYECWCVFSNQEIWPLYVAPIFGQGTTFETWWVHYIIIRCREGTKLKKNPATLPKYYLPNSTFLPIEEFHTFLTNCDIPTKCWKLIFIDTKKHQNYCNN
jgi:hypothetical protein